MKIKNRLVLLLMVTFVLLFANDNNQMDEQKLREYTQFIQSSAPYEFEFLQILPFSGDTVSGKLIYGGQQKFRIILPDEEILFDGNVLWSYSRVTNQTIVENYDISQLKIFPPAIFTGKWEEYVIEKVEQDSLILVTISPESLSMYKFIILTFTPDWNKMIKIDYLDIDNNHFQVLITQSKSVAVDSTDFEYHRKSNEEIIDLRFE